MLFAMSIPKKRVSAFVEPAWTQTTSWPLDCIFAVFFCQLHTEQSSTMSSFSPYNWWFELVSLHFGGCDISYSHNSGCKRFAASKLHWWGAYGLRDGSVVEKAAAVLATISQYQYTLDPCASGDTNDNSYWIVRFGVSAGLEHRLVYNLVQPGTTWPAKSRRCTVTQLRLQGDSTDIAARSESRQTGAKLPWSPSSIMQPVGAGRQVGAFFFGSERSFELLTASFNRFSQMRASSTDGHIIACFSCCVGIFCCLQTWCVGTFCLGTLNLCVGTSCLRTWCVGTCGDGRNLYTTFFDSFGWGETNTTQVRKNNRGWLFGSGCLLAFVRLGTRGSCELDGTCRWKQRGNVGTCVRVCVRVCVR